MRRHKRRIFAGAVCEQIVYNVSDAADVKTSRPRKPRFSTPEEREKFNAEISRQRFARLINQNFSPTSLYSTLTMDDAHEVHTAADARRIRDNFCRRILYKYPAAKLVIVYGKGKSTSRYHLHMISEGIPEEAIGTIWRMGSVIDVRHLRKHNYYIDKDGNKVDHGQDYTSLANYLHGHWQPEFGGHRYKASRTCQKPEAEPATEAVREYSPKHPPIAPRGYTLVEARTTRYGFQYYKYVCTQKNERKRNESRLN